ncbi:MAG: helix-turn-helix domain-containing protein [Lachnospiraceae bacterium]|nr:helix-turn-helix domain-containing protein [Lachnospiraceae bacterium]
MLSNQIIQKSLDELKAITKIELEVYDLEGTKIAGTSSEIDVEPHIVRIFAESVAETQELDNKWFMKVQDEGRDLYVLVACGEQQHAYHVAKIEVNQLEALILAYKEKYDRNNFFQNLILDNLLLVDIYNRAKKLHLEVEAKRIVYLIETKSESETIAKEMLRSLFSQQNGDFVTSVDERNIVLIKSLRREDTEEEIGQTAKTIVDMLNAEAMLSVKVAYGTVVGELKDVSKSYKEAKMALDVGKIFYIEKSVIGYEKLGIGRLIYQLPVNLCRMFMSEIFGENLPDKLDEETQITIHKFFENSLNVSETARQLYIHRNTLVYRIEKLEKETGLDIRNFDDALTFKIALMVVSYLQYLDSRD